MILDYRLIMPNPCLPFVSSPCLFVSACIYILLFMICYTAVLHPGGQVFPHLSRAIFLLALQMLECEAEGGVVIQTTRRTMIGRPTRRNSNIYWISWVTSLHKL